MSNAEIYFLEKARELKSVEKEFVRYTYETKKPEDEEESKKFHHRMIESAFKAIELRNEIITIIKHYVDQLSPHPTSKKYHRVL